MNFKNYFTVQFHIYFKSHIDGARNLLNRKVPYARTGLWVRVRQIEKFSKLRSGRTSRKNFNLSRIILREMRTRANIFVIKSVKIPGKLCNNLRLGVRTSTLRPLRSKRNEATNRTPRWGKEVLRYIVATLSRTTT